MQFVPLLLISCIFGSIMALAASKLGRSKVLWFILAAIPGVNFIFLWVAVWMTVVNLYRRLKIVEEKLGITGTP